MPERVLVDQSDLATKAGKDDLVINVKSYGAVGDGRRVSDASMTSGSSTLMSATAAFTAADVGKRVVVWHAGTTVDSYTVGKAQQLVTTIQTYVNSTTVSLAVSAVTTVTNTRATIATDDTTAVNAAVAMLGKGKELHFPGTSGFYFIQNRITVPANGITVSASSKSVELHMSHVSAPVPCVDAIGRKDITVRDITFVSEDGHVWTNAATSQNTNYRGDGQVVNHSAVWCNEDRLSVQNVHSVDYENTVYISPWTPALGSFAQDGRRADCVLENISCVDQFCTVLVMSTVRLNARHISKTGYVSAYGAPGHTVYHSGTGNSHANYPNGLYSVDLNLHDISMVDDTVSGGGTVSMKWVRGGSVTKLYARNNPLLYSLQLDRVKFDHIVGVDMFQPIDVAGQTFFCVESIVDAFGTGSKNVDIDNVRLGVTSAHASGGAAVAFIHGEDIHIGKMEISTYADSTVTTSRIRELNFWGDRIVVDDLRMTNLAPNDGGASMWPLDFGGSQKVGSLKIRNLALKNWRYMARIFSLYVTDFTIAYDPGVMVGIDNRTLTPPITSNGGNFSALRLHPSEYAREFSITGAGQTVIPSPVMETTTVINATTSDAFTIAAPSISSAATPYPGTTHKVAIRNTTVAALGTITWNASWSLRGALVAPPSGETHVVTFAFNGSTWREISRSNGAVVDTGAALSSLASSSLVAGEFSMSRDLILSNTVTPSSGTLLLSYFMADKSEAITTLTAYTGSVAAAATPTLCRMGVYSVAANGDLTLVASTPNDTSLFAVANTSAPKGLSSTWNKVAGQRYAAGLLVISAATMPNFHGAGYPGTNIMNTITRMSPPTTGRLTSQVELPETISAGSLVGIQGKVAIFMS